MNITSKHLIEKVGEKLVVTDIEITQHVLPAIVWLSDIMFSTLYDASTGWSRRISRATPRRPRRLPARRPVFCGSRWPERSPTCSKRTAWSSGDTPLIRGESREKCSKHRKNGQKALLQAHNPAKCTSRACLAAIVRTARRGGSIGGSGPTTSCGLTAIVPRTR